MADLDKACEYWTTIYLRIVRMGWMNFPKDLEALPVEEKCGILRGMMVDAGKSGLLPSLSQVLDIIEKTGATAPAPPAIREGVPEVAPAQEPPKAETPKAAEPGQQTLAEAPGSIPSPGTKPTAGTERVATEAQVNAIRKFCETPRLKGFVAETLRKIGKGSAPQLSFSEAFELVAKLYDMSSGRIPPGAKVETGVKT